jgi:hypothetical protein
MVTQMLLSGQVSIEGTEIRKNVILNGGFDENSPQVKVGCYPHLLCMF